MPMTIRDEWRLNLRAIWVTSVPSENRVRYGINGEDEDYERELERVRRCGGAPPAAMSAVNWLGLIVLVGAQAVLFIFLALGLVLARR